MSQALAPQRAPSDRGPAWEAKRHEIRVRDGAYQTPDGRLHLVCRNWLECQRQGLEPMCNGYEEVWVCHAYPWALYPALRLCNDNLMALCRHCDPDRNPAVRPGYWWGTPHAPNVAGYRDRQRNGRARRTFRGWLWHHLIRDPLYFIVWTFCMVAVWGWVVKPMYVNYPTDTPSAALSWFGWQALWSGLGGAALLASLILAWRHIVVPGTIWVWRHSAVALWLAYRNTRKGH